MKKIFTFSVLLFCIFGILQGFAAGRKSMADKNTLTVFHYLDLADQAAAANFEEVRAAFEVANPDIKLEFDYLVNEPYHNKLQALTVADELPDVMFLWPGKRTGQVTGSGKIKDLRPYVAGNESLFSEVALAPQGANGEIWELPEQVTATHVIFVNNRLLDELNLSYPRTLQELLNQGDKIRAAGLIPLAIDNKDGWQMQSLLLSALVARTGGRDWLDSARVGNGASFTDAEFVEALQVIKTLSDADMFSPGVNQADYGAALTDFVNEDAVYLIDGGWRVNNLVTELTPEQYEYVSLEVFPALSNNEAIPGSTAIVTGTGFGMNANLDSDKADLAWKWIWFYSGPEGSTIRQRFGALPAAQVPRPADFPVLSRKLADFLGGIPGGYVIDAVMDAEGMGVLHPAIQEMMFGNLTARQAAQQYEDWVAANDGGRK